MIIDEESEKRIDEEPTYLSVDQSAHLIFFSFRFSQGEPNLQRAIFRYLHLIQPSWRIREDEESIKKLQNTLTDRGESFLFSGVDEYDEKPKWHGFAAGNISRSAIKAAMENEIKDAKRVFSDEKPEQHEYSSYSNDWKDAWYNKGKRSIVDFITRRIIYRDRYFMDKKYGRVRQHTSQSSPPGDPWSSHIIDYAIRGETTHLPEFDEMFRDIRDYILSEHSQDQDALADGWSDMKNILEKVEAVYNLHHPENTVSIYSTTTVPVKEG